MDFKPGDLFTFYHPVGSTHVRMTGEIDSDNDFAITTKSDYGEIHNSWLPVIEKNGLYGDKFDFDRDRNGVITSARGGVIVGTVATIPKITQANYRDVCGCGNCKGERHTTPWPFRDEWDNLSDI